MTPAQLPAWVFWSGLGCLSVGVLLCLWALAADWARGWRKPPRRRCPKCWYDMSAVGGRTCPECGRTPRDERGLHRARRRWGVALLSLLLILPGAGATGYRYFARVNWLKTAPSILLVTMVDQVHTPLDEARAAWGGGKIPKSSELDRACCRELFARYERWELSLRVRRMLAAKQFGAAGYDPVVIETRDAWPDGQPVVVSLDPRIDGPFPREIRVTPRFPEAQTAMGYSPGWAAQSAMHSMYSGPRWLQSVGVPPSGSRSIVWDVSVMEGTDELWRGTVTTPTQISGTYDSVLQPISSEEATAAVRRVCSSRLTLTNDCRWLEIRPGEIAGLKGTTAAVVVEFVSGGVVVASARPVWIPHSDLMGRLGATSWFFPSESRSATFAMEGDVVRLASLRDERAPCEMRVRGNPQEALSDFRATRSWAGEFVIPVDWPSLSEGAQPGR